MELSIKDTKLLTDYINSAKIESEGVLDILCTLKIEKVKEVHKYKLTPPRKGKNGLWQTYVYDEKYYGNRRKIKGKTEKEVYLQLYEYYFENTVTHTLESIFEDWLLYRKDKNKSDLTIDRYRNYWNRYYKDSSISKKPLHQITAEDIEDFLHSCIKKFSMTKKELTSMSIIIRDCLKFAKRRKYISSNPFNDAEINKDSCSPPQFMLSPLENRVFFEDEKEKFSKELACYIEKNDSDTQCYAVALLFSLGLRIGELLALTWDKIDLKHSLIHINCMITIIKDENNKNQTVVVDHCKNGQDYSIRSLALSEKDLEIFKTIKKTNELNGFKHDNFIFCGLKGWMTRRQVDNRVRYLCKKADILPERSCHDIRRTVASELYAKGIELETIRNFLGHEDVKTTKSYIYDFNKTMREHEAILNAKTGLKGLKIG